MIKQFFATLLAIFVSLGILFGIFSIFIFFALKDTKPEVKNGSVLVLNLNQPISDKPVSVDPSDFAQDLLLGATTVSNTFTLRELMATIRYAAEDDRIAGIYLTGGVPTGDTYFSGSATLKEVRDALQDFRDTGKPIYAWNSSYNMRSYFLASVADSIFIHPFGSLGIPGYSTSRTFYKGALDRFGVKLYISRAGAYKSALETYFLTEMSDEDREQRMLLLEGHYNQFAEHVSASRGMPIGEIHAFSSDLESMRNPESALEAGLIDRVAYYDEVLAALRAFTGVEDESKPFTQVSYGNYHSNVSSKLFPKSKDKIALVYAEGGIVSGSGTSNVAGDYMARLLRQIRTDDDVKAVVLRVNSPGGGVYPSEVILREMRLLSEEKPVVVSMGNVAASGGYWISSYAGHIFANQTTVTGSIGVYSMFPVLDEIAGEYGINFDGIKSHPFADFMTSDRSPTETEWELFHQNTMDIYDDFLDRVVNGRNMDKDAAHEIAQGRVWTGADALELGLVDEIGGLNDAISKAAELAELEKWEVKTYQRAEDLRQKLMEFFGVQAEAGHGTNALSETAVKFFSVLGYLNQLDDPNGMYVRLPYDIIIE